MIVLMAFYLCNISWTSMIVTTTLAAVKTAYDHSVYNTHHRLHHVDPRCNFEQPFFDVWDRCMGTKRWA